MSCWIHQFWNNQPQDFLIYEIRNFPVIKGKKLHWRSFVLQTKCFFFSSSLESIGTYDLLLWSSIAKLHGHSLLTVRRERMRAGWWGAMAAVGRQLYVRSHQELLALFPTLLINRTMHANSLPWQFTCFRSFVTNKVVFPFHLAKVWNENN